ncbi:MAG: amidohydrolase [Sutterella sp.]|nr:amidohydrolase [Sutterella sp.]
MNVLVRPQDLQAEARLAADIRHRIHREPEIGLHLPKTAAVIEESLKAFGADEIHTHVGGSGVTGIVAVIRGNRSGRTIGLRADADALPLEENTGAAWSSTVPKCMHACGHDGHVATLLSAVAWLTKHRDFAGTLCAVFQPGEEGYAGGRHMVEDGLVTRFGIEEFYALHAEPSVPVGSVAFVPGYATANADVFEIIFEGKGGHGSRPQLARDPIIAAGEALLALQTIASRSAPPDKTAVISVCSLLAGDADGTSVIPQKAVLRGTARSFEPEVQDIIETRLKEIARGIAIANGMTAEVNYTRLYPAMYNDPARTADARALLEALLGPDHVEDFRRTPGGEDFSFMLRERPGCLFRLGMKDETHTRGVHNEGFDFNDRAIAVGAASLLTIALSRMAA